jgi:hypothetical protein
MLVEIKPDIFGGKDFKGINYLVQISSYRNRIELVVDLPKVKQTPYYQRLDSDDRALLEQNFMSYMTSQSQIVNSKDSFTDAAYFVTNNSNADNEFDLQEANIFFEQKLSILLENNLNDSHFIRAIISHFDQKGRATVIMESGGLLFDNAGGCKNYKNFISARLATYAALPKKPELYLRCIVILDSDRTHPSQNLEANHETLIKDLNSWGVPYHILEKRMMENYMPDEVFDEYISGVNAPWIEARKYLSEVQKDHLSIPNGFTKKGANNVSLELRTDLPVDIQSLFDGISTTNFDILDKGLQIGNFKRNFPEKFITSHNVHRNTLLNRIANQNNTNELQEILNKITKLL